MLSALQIAEARAIAEASRRRSRDERAMVAYLGIGRRARPATMPASPALLTDPIDLAAFESEERRSLEQAIERLSPEARRELIALVWIGRRAALDFAAAMRRTRRIPPPAQAAYLMGIRLECYIDAGIERLGYRGV